MRGERSALRKEELEMDRSLVHILLKAKAIDKWVPLKYLNHYGIREVDLLNLEDEGLLLVTNRKSDGKLLKLTLKGYHHFNK